MSGALQPHPKYKESGVEWLGVVPEGWEVLKASWILEARKGRFAQHLTREYCSDNAGEYPVYSGQTEDGGIMGKIDWFEFDSGDDGAVLATTVGAKAMSVSHIRGSFSLSQNCMTLHPFPSRTSARYLYYSLQPLFQFERALIPEHMQASFRMEDLYIYRVSVPPFDSQSTIITYLNRETAKINRLISETEDTITLMQERRAALISPVVTGKLQVPSTPQPGRMAAQEAELPTRPSGSTLNSRPETLR